MGVLTAAPIILAIGGFAGSGKSTVSRRLSRDLSIPRLGSDTIGRTVTAALARHDPAARASYAAYAVLFALAEEFVGSGVTTILDINLGWDFQWQRLDELRARHPHVHVQTLILRCPLDVCLDRIRARHAARPDYYDPPELFTATPKIMNTWRYLERLDRPDAPSIDAARPHDEVYADVRRHLAPSLPARCGGR